jgi:hypothetical protein
MIAPEITGETLVPVFDRMQRVAHGLINTDLACACKSQRVEVKQARRSRHLGCRFTTTEKTEYNNI